MSMRNYGIYEQGAIFDENDFDPVKVIMTTFGITGTAMPENVRTALENNEFTTEIAAELRAMLDIEIEDIAEIHDYSGISNILIDESNINEWFEHPNPIMGSSEVCVCGFTDIEGEFIYDTSKPADIAVENCYMFALPIPFVWNIGSYEGCRTREETIAIIRENAKPLLKNDIDWDTRLGYLIGSDFG